MSTRVKICGVRSLADASVAANAGAWAVGFNFFRQSRRYLAPEQARQIAAALPAEVQRVGVFVNSPRSEMEAIVETVGLTMLQFHGDEPPELCCDWPVPTIKALRWRDRNTAVAAQAYAVDFVLADAYVEGAFGGTGKKIDPELLRDIEPARLILAGGLTPDNVGELVARLHPYAVDVASGVESEPGVKDATMIRRFIENANLT
ncbi:MAG TPA: phosphoribosylanthranilate isomerase [Terriglobales bacterium]|nr:phosphoribosylanthranilate isomerase [Terriglobales bacterium]